jgi:hypothetical protein
MDISKHFGRLLGLFGFGQTASSDLFDVRLERCRLREARRVTSTALFRKTQKRQAV